MRTRFRASWTPNERALEELESRVAELAQIRADAAISGASLALGIAASPLTFGLGMAFGLASAGFGGWGLRRESRQPIDGRRDRAAAEAIRDAVVALRAVAERIEAAIQLAQS